MTPIKEPESGQEKSHLTILGLGIGSVGDFIKCP
jgi:hypothetical protein